MDQSSFASQRNNQMHGAIKYSLPNMKVNVPLALSSNKIFEIFGQVSKLQDFEIIEMEQSIATAVYKEPYSIKQMLLKCLPCSTKELTQSPEFNEIEDMSM